MPDYKYTGAVPRALFGLQQGVNATVERTPDEPQLDPGQTIVVIPGDGLHTDEPYPHAELEPVDPTATPPVAPAPVAAPAPAPVVTPAPAPAEPVAAPTEPSPAPAPVTPAL